MMKEAWRLWVLLPPKGIPPRCVVLVLDLTRALKQKPKAPQETKEKQKSREKQPGLSRRTHVHSALGEKENIQAEKFRLSSM